ncbi:RNA polymerase factor sigma-54 [Candidatus Hakubella thermalkaliphila]|uniref:RNA polymerase factor sigma-54 n=1 Tax=Candidatus Hakubella thermalkaliphila TaxID=2754717 RepID=UPI00387ED970
MQKEDPQNPYTDSQLSRLVGADGLYIGRRIVAKYRSSLKISPSHLRRRGNL